MKVKLREGAPEIPNIIIGKDYNVYWNHSMCKKYIYDETNSIMYYSDTMFRYSDVPEIKETKTLTPSLEAMNKKETTKSGTQYVCPMDLFGGSIKKGDIYSKCVNDNYYEPNSFNNTSHLLPAEIVETWEKVQEDVFVNCEKVVFKNGGAHINGIFFLKHEIKGMVGLTPEDINKIIERLG